MSDDTPKRKKVEEVTLPDPDVVMSSAREALQAMREAAVQKLQAAQAELDGINQKLDRIAAYFDPPATKEPVARKPRTTSGTRKPRQSGVRDGVLAEIAKHPEGIKRADLLTAMGATEKNAQQSISNAVAALKKDGKITADQGLYRSV